LDYLPRKHDDDCLMELRWFYDRRDIEEVRRDIAQWIMKWQGRYPKLVGWVEENVEETLTYYRLPRAHHKHMKSTNMLERLNQELKRRTLVVRIFPNTASYVDGSAPAPQNAISHDAFAELDAHNSRVFPGKTVPARSPARPPIVVCVKFCKSVMADGVWRGRR